MKSRLRCLTMSQMSHITLWAPLQTSFLIQHAMPRTEMSSEPRGSTTCAQIVSHFLNANYICFTFFFCISGSKPSSKTPQKTYFFRPERRSGGDGVTNISPEKE